MGGGEGRAARRGEGLVTREKWVSRRTKDAGSCACQHLAL